VIGDGEDFPGDATERAAQCSAHTATGAPKPPDGSPMDGAATKLAVQDREWLDRPADVTFERFKRSDLEPMNIPPSVVSALQPIIEQ
jgi:hypothetical protein